MKKVLNFLHEALVINLDFNKGEFELGYAWVIVIFLYLLGLVAKSIILLVYFTKYILGL